MRLAPRSADAVAQAVRAVRAADPDPFAWAPFLLVGRDDTIDWSDAGSVAPAATSARP